LKVAENKKVRRPQRLYRRLAAQNESRVDSRILVNMDREKGFETEESPRLWIQPIDVVWRISVHAAVPEIRYRFIVMKATEEGTPDAADKQFSLRKIEEAAFRGPRSGMDRTYIVAENVTLAKAISGKIEWLASHGSLLRLHTFSLGLSPDQKESSMIIPSQKRVPKGKKSEKKRCVSWKPSWTNTIDRQAQEENKSQKKRR
jgi:hypothetical protein